MEQSESEDQANKPADISATTMHQEPPPAGEQIATPQNGAPRRGASYLWSKLLSPWRGFWNLSVGDRSSAVIAAATTLYTLVAFYQLSAIREQIRENRLAASLDREVTEKSIAVAAKSAEAAREANRIALQSIAPDLYVATIEVDLKTGIFGVVFANRGQSVARAVRNEVSYVLNPDLATDPCVFRGTPKPSMDALAKRQREAFEFIKKTSPGTPEAEAHVAELEKNLLKVPPTGPLTDPVGEIPPGLTLKYRDQSMFAGLPPGYVIFMAGHYSFGDRFGTSYEGTYCFRYADGDIARWYAREGSVNPKDEQANSGHE